MKYNVDNIKLIFLIRLDIAYLSLKSLSLPVRRSRISAIFVVLIESRQPCNVLWEILAVKVCIDLHFEF